MSIMLIIYLLTYLQGILFNGANYSYDVEFTFAAYPFGGWFPGCLGCFLSTSEWFPAFSNRSGSNLVRIWPMQMALTLCDYRG